MVKVDGIHELKNLGNENAKMNVKKSERSKNYKVNYKVYRKSIKL